MTCVGTSGCGFPLVSTKDPGWHMQGGRGGGGGGWRVGGVLDNTQAWPSSPNWLPQYFRQTCN